jgi:DNA-directed RNA polymerase
MNRKDIQRWQPWGRANRIKLGGWLLNCIIETSQWFTKDMRQKGKRVNYVVPTPEFISIKDKVMADAELFAPLAWPMLIEPNDWTNESAGGYILNEVMRGHDLVRRGDPTCIQGETPINFLNKIQKVAFTLNPFTVQVAEELDRLERAVGKFLPVVKHELPPKPVDIAENREARKAYNRAATHVQDLQHQEHKKSCRTRMTMEAVKKVQERS